MEGKMDVESSKITNKGQIVISAKLRRRTGFKPGTKVFFIERNNEILFQPLIKEYVRSVQGMLASDTPLNEELLKHRAVDRGYEEAKKDLLPDHSAEPAPLQIL
jgi:AbrB family looped-hinge helix DNA binding protein